MGISRDTLYYYQEQVETSGIDALINQSRRTPNLKNRVGCNTEQIALKYAVDLPDDRKVRTGNELRKIFLQVASVQSGFVMT